MRPLRNPTHRTTLKQGRVPTVALGGLQSCLSENEEIPAPLKPRKEANHVTFQETCNFPRTGLTQRHGAFIASVTGEVVQGRVAIVALVGLVHIGGG